MIRESVIAGPQSGSRLSHTKQMLSYFPARIPYPPSFPPFVHYCTSQSRTHSVFDGQRLLRPVNSDYLSIASLPGTVLFMASLLAI